ncbi:Os03g0365700, partial [Oryza sativa Japonica Group]
TENITKPTSIIYYRYRFFKKNRHLYSELSRTGGLSPPHQPLTHHAFFLFSPLLFFLSLLLSSLFLSTSTFSSPPPSTTAAACAEPSPLPDPVGGEAVVRR